jgi:hypothetical protein
MRAFVFAVALLLFALLSAQSSAQTRTIVRAHAIASAWTYDTERLEETGPTEAPASPREVVQESLIDPADGRGAERRSAGHEESTELERRARPKLDRRYESVPAQALLRLDVPPPR